MRIWTVWFGTRQSLTEMLLTLANYCKSIACDKHFLATVPGYAQALLHFGHPAHARGHGHVTPCSCHTSLLQKPARSVFALLLTMDAHGRVPVHAHARFSYSWTYAHTICERCPSR